MKTNVIVVGNGSSVLERENGKIIDNFDNIVRFNNFKIEGFEKYVGKKTTHWYNTIGSEKLKDTTKPKEIIWHSWQWDEHKDLKYKEFLKNYPSAKKTTKQTILEMQEYIGDKEYFHYSTGLIAIWDMLRNHDNVIITGFDWWEKRDKHHYHNSQKIGNIHKPDKEFKVIDKLSKCSRLLFM